MSKTIADLMTNLNRVKTNPSLITRIIFDHLQEIKSGEVNIVDPSNPFVFLLTTSAVNTALAVNETISLHRRLYPSLAQTTDDLYLHMSDKDFLDRFASPADTVFTFAFMFSDIKDRLIYVPSERCYKGTIPRDTEIEIDGIIFTLDYPIDIRKYDSGLIISYDTSINNPTSSLTSNNVNYRTLRSPDQIDWLFIDVPMRQLSIRTSFYTLQNSLYFKEKVEVVDQYYFARVFYRNNNSGNQWVEMKTTHTDQVFDATVPTAVLRVTEGLLEVSVPPVYQTTGLVSGEIRIDVYSTKGKLNLNFVGYRPTAYTVRLKAIDRERDVTDYSNIIGQLTYYVYNDRRMVGGKNLITYEELRHRVIENSVGDQKLPITNVELTAEVNNNGFDLVKNVDVVTNRIFLATQRLPKPINPQLITAANIGMATFIASFDTLKAHRYVINNHQRVTVLSRNLYESQNGIVRQLAPEEIEQIKALAKVDLVAYVNARQFLYSPYYYVLDNSQNEFDIRIYDLDYPTAYDLNFVEQNMTLQLPVNTGSYRIDKIDEGYRITVVTKSGNHYKQLPDTVVFLQLGFKSKGESTQAYVDGRLVGKTSDDERIYEFDLLTNYDVDSDGYLCITNAKMFSNEVLKTWIKLDTDISLYYITSSLIEGYLPSKSDQLAGRFLFNNAVASVTHEKISVTLGKHLKNLWSRSRTLPTYEQYERYDSDVPLLYTEDVYKIDPVTGSIFSIDPVTKQPVYTILHHKGDPVLNPDGTLVLLHRKGDIVMSDNKPVLLDSESFLREYDLLFVDGRYFFADNQLFKDYRDEVAAIITTWVTDNLLSIQGRLLEKTKIFFYPKTTLGTIKVQTSSKNTEFIYAEQTFRVEVYVRDNVYQSYDLKEAIKATIVKGLDALITDKTILIDEATKTIKDSLKDSVVSLRISGLAGSANYNMLTVVDDSTRLCLRKRLEQQSDGKVAVIEDVEYEFINVDAVV